MWSRRQKGMVLECRNEMLRVSGHWAPCTHIHTHIFIHSHHIHILHPSRYINTIFTPMHTHSLSPPHTLTSPTHTPPDSFTLTLTHAYLTDSHTFTHTHSRISMYPHANLILTYMPSGKFTVCSLLAHCHAYPQVCPSW